MTEYPDVTEYFAGERPVASFKLLFHRGRASLSGTVSDHWEERLSRSLSCGNKHSRKLTRKVGVTVSERDDLEGTVKTSFGLKGIAELKSELKSKIGHEIQWDRSEEIEEEFEWKAPKCGRRTISLYQLQRVYRLSFEDERFWHHDSWTRTIAEWLERIADQSKHIENDPGCGCRHEPEAGGDGLINLVLDKITMLVPFREQRGCVDFPTIGMSLRARSVDHLFRGTYTVERKYIPAYLLFLADANAATHQARFRPYTAPEVTALSETERPVEVPRRLMARLIYLLAGAGFGAVAGSLLVRSPQARGYLDERIEQVLEAGREWDEAFRSAYESGRRSAAKEQANRGA